MALQSSGEISLSDVNVELGNASNATINMGGTAVRDLFGLASGAISMSSGYGAANSPFTTDYSASGWTLQADSYASGYNSYYDWVVSAYNPNGFWKLIGDPEYFLRLGSSGFVEEWKNGAYYTTYSSSSVVVITNPTAIGARSDAIGLEIYNNNSQMRTFLSAAISTPSGLDNWPADPCNVQIKVVNTTGTEINWSQDGCNMGNYNGFTWLEILGGQPTNQSNFNSYISLVTSGNHLQVWSKATV